MTFTLTSATVLPSTKTQKNDSPLQRRVLAVDDQLGLALLADAGGRQRAVARGGRGGVAGEAADAGLLADGRGGGAPVGHRLGQRELQVALGGAGRRLVVHGHDVRQHREGVTRKSVVNKRERGTVH